MENPDAVEVDEEMCSGTFLEVGLEKDPVPVNTSQLRVPFSRGYVN
jgi:hypothetical protein